MLTVLGITAPFSALVNGKFDTSRNASHVQDVHRDEFVTDRDSFNCCIVKPSWSPRRRIQVRPIQLSLLPELSKAV